MNINMNNIINNKYRILERIGSGAFGSIYKGVNVRTKEFVAIKIERIIDNLKLLKNESIIYQHLKDCDSIPKVKWFGKDNENYYMVINLLGVSLQTMKQNMGSFSLRLTLKIGIKMLSLIKNVHDKGLVHRDIKPDNFLFGLDKLKDLYIIDFGFCKSYLLEDGTHMVMKPIASLIGSMNYASLSSHKRRELSRRDDLESMCYILLYFFYGRLPWANETNEQTVMKMKYDIINDVNTNNNIILNTLNYVRKLSFEETPNYYLIINNMKEMIHPDNK